jgi:hypothetical protein
MNVQKAYSVASNAIGKRPSIFSIIAGLVPGNKNP